MNIWCLFHDANYSLPLGKSINWIGFMFRLDINLRLYLVEWILGRMEKKKKRGERKWGIKHFWWVFGWKERREKKDKNVFSPKWGENWVGILNILIDKNAHVHLHTGNSFSSFFLFLFNFFLFFWFLGLWVW